LRNFGSNFQTNYKTIEAATNMGDAADYYLASGLDADFPSDEAEDEWGAWGDWRGNRRPAYPVSKNKWRLADGSVVKISDMGDRHLENTIAYLKRTGNTGLPQFARMERELLTRERVI
jgi:hypothetical protein